MAWDIILEHYLLWTIVILYLASWLFTYLTCGVCKSNVRLDGKTVLITGCNSGLGKATALDLARRGARVIMACRNLERANVARESIVEATKNNNVVVKIVDISSLSSIRKFAEEINRTEQRLDILIHNAGVVESPKRTTEEGLNLFWTTNHFGPFLLTHLLIDLLKRTGKSRVIVLSSILHVFGEVKPVKPEPISRTRYSKLYSNTKFANILFANELARRLEGTGVTANSLHPGIIYTTIWDRNPIWVHLILHLLKPFFKTEEQGAQTTIHLAVSEDVEGVSGKFFLDCREWSPAKKTRDTDLARKFWKISEEVVELEPSDPHM